MAENDGGAKGEADETERKLLAIAHMFGPHRENALMRELCRLAVKCAQEGPERG